MKKARQLNFEVLRIVSIMMVITAHYLGKGGALTAVTEQFSINSYISWFLEAFCLMSINLYVLISGYFGTSATFSLEKAGKLWGQIFFYSFTIGIVAMICNLQTFDPYIIFAYMFPVATEHYWFATEYLLLYIMMPFLNTGFKKMDQEKIRNLIGLLLIITMIAKTVIPMKLPTDLNGYDVIWLITVYLTGAYIREYGIKWIKSRLRGLITCLLGGIAMFVGMLFLREIYLKTGMLKDMISYTYAFNHLFCYIGSIGLFMAFDTSNVCKESLDSNVGRGKQLIYTMASATFGVYLIHEHMNIRYLWPKWFACEKYANAPVGLFLAHMTITVLVVFLVCAVIEIARQKLVHGMFEIWSKKGRNGNERKEV